MKNNREKEGIYKITCKENNRVYIGRSIDIDNRLKTHKYSLKAGRHTNKKLQEDFNKYGEGAFLFEAKKYTGKPLDTLYYESYYAEKYDVFNKGYNKVKLSKSKSIKRIVDNLDYYVERFKEITDQIPEDKYSCKTLKIDKKLEDFFKLDRYDIGVMVSILTSYIGFRYGLKVEMNISRTEIYLIQTDINKLHDALMKLDTI